MTIRTLVLCALAACASVPITERPSVVREAGQPLLLYPYRVEVLDSIPGTDNLAVTGCHKELGQPVIAIRRDVAESPQYVPVMAHELTHLRQVARISTTSCVPFMERYAADSTFRLAMETEAYCVEAETGVVVLGWDRPNALQSFARVIRWRYAPALDSAQAVGFITHVCDATRPHS